MPSGYTVTGRGDLDAIFKARTSAAGAATNLKASGVDLNQRYEVRGSTTPVANTGYQVSGVDLAQKFMDSGAISNAITITDRTANATDSTAPSGTATASYSLTSAGDIVATNGSNSTADVGDWLTPLTHQGDFSVMATIVSGSLSSGTTGAWLNLGTTRSWSVARGALGTTTAVIDIAIRSDADGFTRATARITLAATRAPLRLTAGLTSPEGSRGYNRGASVGALVPSQIGGKNVEWILDTSGPSTVILSISSATALAKSFFSTITINGVGLTTAGSTFVTTDAPFYRWSWPGSNFGMVNGGVYDVAIT